jgi:protein-L-isoaspartate(D-aspartate) O-methyltransferase
MTRTPGAPPGARFPAGLKPASSGAARAPASTVLRPQRPLHEAARDAVPRATPSGLGLDSAAVRERMVARLHADGVRCQPVLQAFAHVPRHRFVDTALATQAYEDTSLPIGLQQTISKPSVVARMLSLLFEGDSARTTGSLGRTLEIGTGCGYQTALLALLASRVLSIERLKPLHDKARLNLVDWRAGDVRLVYGDGRHGHAPRAPYDSIVAAAGGEDLPAAWLDQLAVGGRLIAPLHDAGAGGQVLVVVDRRSDGLHRRVHDAVHFVPLKSGME